MELPKFARVRFILHQVNTSCGSLRAGGGVVQVATRVSLAVLKKLAIIVQTGSSTCSQVRQELAMSNLPPAPPRLFRPHPSKPLSVSPLCIPTARRCGGDSATPPARCPATSIQTLSLNPQRTGSCQPSGPDGESCEKGGGSRCSRPFDLT